MSEEKPLDGVGVVVGRFQVDELTDGHVALLDKAARHKKLLVFLGVHRIPVTKDHPMDFPTRKGLIKEEYPDATVVAIMDEPTNEAWSRSLNRLVRTYCPVDGVTLYSGRDGFAEKYAKGFKTVFVDHVSPASGTAVRNHTGQTVQETREFRAGVIYAAHNMYPRLSPTVDIALVRKTKLTNGNIEAEVLLGMKAERAGQWRFPGGFIDRRDGTAEAAAKRELYEETKMMTSALRYLHSMVIEDWRSTSDTGILTTFFEADFEAGAPEASDDLDGVKWFRVSQLDKINMVEAHRTLRDVLMKAHEND